jgi:hypothetical protein
MAGRFSATLSKAAKLSGSEWLYLVVATKELFFARLRHAVEPTGRIVESLHRSSSNGVRDSSEIESGPNLTRLAWALGAASTRVPWRSDCLIQVMAADRWLRRHHIQSSFFLGVAKDAGGALRAHAWLRHGATIVAGASGDGYATLVEPHRSSGKDLLW